MADEYRFQTFFNKWLAAKKLRPYQACPVIGISQQTAYAYSNGQTFPRHRKAHQLAKAMRLSKPKRAALFRLLTLDREMKLAAKRTATR